MSGRLGELLVRENLISVQQLRKAQEEQQKTGTRIGSALVKTGAIEESKLTDFLSRQYGVPAINLRDFDIDPDILKLVPKEVAEKHLVIPVNRAGPGGGSGSTSWRGAPSRPGATTPRVAKRRAASSFVRSVHVRSSG